jgi:hypothetical protein
MQGTNTYLFLDDLHVRLGLGQDGGLDPETSVRLGPLFASSEDSGTLGSSALDVVEHLGLLALGNLSNQL